MAAHERILDPDYDCSPPVLIEECYDGQSAQCSSDNNEQNEKRVSFWGYFRGNANF